MLKYPCDTGIVLHGAKFSVKRKFLTEISWKQLGEHLADCRFCLILNKISTFFSGILEHLYYLSVEHTNPSIINRVYNSRLYFLVG